MTNQATPTGCPTSACISPVAASALIKQNGAMLVDVREVDEYRRQHIPGAALIPTSAFSPESFPGSGDERVTLVHCASGRRSEQVANTLRAAGRTNVIAVEGGIKAWAAAGLPVRNDAKVQLPIIRQVMIAAGLMLVGFTALAATVSPWFLAGTGFIGAGFVFAGVTGICAMGKVLSAMPWNNATASSTTTSSGGACSSGKCCG